MAKTKKKKAMSPQSIDLKIKCAAETIELLTNQQHHYREKIKRDPTDRGAHHFVKTTNIFIGQADRELTALLKLKDKK